MTGDQPNTDGLRSTERRGPFAHTPGPWTVGAWYGCCRKTHIGGTHPGPRGSDGCVYEYTLQPATLESGYMPGIAGPESQQMVVSNSYDSLCIKLPDALLIAAAPDLLDVVRDLVEYGGVMEYDTYRHLIQRAEKAIAKAEGK